MPISDDIADLYAHLVTFQASALAFVSNGVDEDDRLDRANQVKDALETARGSFLTPQGSFGTITMSDGPPGICTSPNVDCGGVCVPPDMCNFIGSNSSAVVTAEVKV